MSEYRSPQYLNDKTYKNQPVLRIRCPIHGFIHFSEYERKIIDHWIFQRLRFIRQLAFTEYVYPGAIHTRFEHSLGAMEVATMFFDGIAARKGETIEKTFQELPELKEDTLAKARQILRLAALLHDVGHPCFSHAAEKVFFHEGDHETLTVEIIESEELLGRLLNETFWDGCAEMVANVLNKHDGNLPPQLIILRDLISGQMDADRTDYLIRDSYHCGVDYGRFDYRRLVECLDIYKDDNGNIELALAQDGLLTFEALILARYQINSQVYYHRLRRLYDRYLKEYFNTLGEETPHDAESILRYDDYSMFAKIRQNMQCTDPVRRRWAKRICEREHHKQVIQTSGGADNQDKRLIKQLEPELRERFEGVEFLLDDEAGPNIHKLEQPGDREEGIRIHLTHKGGAISTVNEESMVFRRIPKFYDCFRIFADTKDDKFLEEIQNFAEKKLQSLRG